MRDQTAIVGLGTTPYYKRGQSAPQTLHELVGKAILAALDDAGLGVRDVDGFAYFAGGFDTGLLMETLGIPEIRFTASLTGTGGGSAGAVGLAAAAIISGQAETVVVVGGNQQAEQRLAPSPPATNQRRTARSFLRQGWSVRVTCLRCWRGVTCICTAPRASTTPRWP